MAYTSINDPSAHFQTATYTGNGSSISITNGGNSDLQPDWVWIKNRTQYQPQEYDTSRGVHKKLMTSIENAESTDTTALTAFNTDGFSTGSNVGVNQNSTSHVAWQWKVNGGTTSTNTTGSVDSVVQVNTDAGFSIVTFDSASSGNFSVGHGLGVQPAMIITKNREGTSNWWTWHKGLTGGNSNTSYVVALERTNAEASYANAWGAGVTSSVFGMQSGNTAVASNDYVAYCFADVQGYSKFGSYVGNGNADGPFVYTGFKPAWIMCKNSTTAGDNWEIRDNKRNDFNPQGKALYANLNAAEYNATAIATDSLSNGFKVRATDHGLNESGQTYIYMAFAENPFVTSTGIPTTAR